MAPRLMLSIRRAQDQFLENFLFAGSSALLLSMANAHPGLWFVSLFALIPFLWRAVRASLRESILLGALLAVSYCLVTVPFSLWLALDGLPLKLLTFCALFIVYAAAVNRAAKWIGFNAVLIALLWLPIEYVLDHYAYVGDTFALSDVNSSLLIRLGSLFGMLMVSFAIVLVNSLLIITVELAIAMVRGASACFVCETSSPLYINPTHFCQQRYYTVAKSRAPPGDSPFVHSLLITH